MVKHFCDICGKEIDTESYYQDGCYFIDRKFCFKLEPINRNSTLNRYNYDDVCKDCADKFYKLIDEIQMQN